MIACEVTNSYDEQDSALQEMYRELIDRAGNQGTALSHVTGAPMPLAATEKSQSSTEVNNSAELDDAVPSPVCAMKDDSNSRDARPCPSTPPSHGDRAIRATLPCTTHALNLLTATSRIVESIDCEMSKGSAATGGSNCHGDAALCSRDVSVRSIALDGPLPTEASTELTTFLPETIPATVSSSEIDINEEAPGLLSAIQSSLSVSAPSHVLKSCASPTKATGLPDATLTSPAATRDVITESLSPPHSCEPKQVDSKLHLVGRPQTETRVDDMQLSSLRECDVISAQVEPNTSRAEVKSSNTIPTLVQVPAELIRQKNTGAVQIMPCPVIQPHSISLRELIFGGSASAASPLRPVPAPVPVNLLVDLPTHLPVHLPVPVPVLPSIPHQQHIIKGDQSSHVAELALVPSSPPKIVIPIIATASTSSMSSSTASIAAEQDEDVDKVIKVSPAVNDPCEDTLLADCSQNKEGKKKGQEEKEEEREERRKEKEEERVGKKKEKEEEMEGKKKEKEDEREGKKKEKEDERQERRKEKKEKKEKKEMKKDSLTSKKRCATESAKELEVSEGILSQKKQKKESKKSSSVICEIVREKRKYKKRNQTVNAEIVAHTRAHTQGLSESEAMDCSEVAHLSVDIGEKISLKESDSPTVDAEEETVEEPIEEEEDIEEDETPWTAAPLLQLMSYRPLPSVSLRHMISVVSQMIDMMLKTLSKINVPHS